MRPPSPHPFLAADAGAAHADALLIGVASGADVSFRGGAQDGPSGIRLFSDSIESWSPRRGADLEDLAIRDLGDYAGPASGAERVVDDVLAAAWQGAGGPLLVSLGGDHAVTPPIVRAVARRTGPLAVVGFDAHLDMREKYEGEHACTFRRLADAGHPCVVLGPRSGSRAEWESVPGLLRYCDAGLGVPAAVRAELQDVPVYLTIDIDVLDPSVAPGTGNPEPGGASFLELLEAVEALEGLNIVAADVVEVSPPLDPSGITQAAAAMLVREILLLFAPRR